MLEAIVAVYSDWGIGCCGTQPVVVSEDRRHFREVTSGSAVIVGRKTLADFPGGKPLKNRTNIVLTSQNVTIEGAVVAHSIAEALSEADKCEKVFVIGGASVYNALFSEIGRVYVTKVEAKPQSDSFFPNLDADPDWSITERSEEKEENGVKYQFLTYERR